MDTKLYHLRTNLWLMPLPYNGDPEVRVMFHNKLIYSGLLSDSKVFAIDEQLPPGDYQWSVEFLNKFNTDTDINAGKDKSVIVNQVTFNNITDPKFAWAGEYCPDYPEPWYSEQQVKPETTLKSCTYLGWNGKWTLTFSMPVFTWIHKIQDLGWIYD